MKKPSLNKYHLSPLFLLFIYLLGNSPAFIIHSHDHSNIDFNQANSCEKEIYFSYADGGCKHKAHLSKPIKNCFFCDHHNISLQYFIRHFDVLTENSKTSIQIHSLYCPFQTDTKAIKGRGPPQAELLV